MSQQDLKVECVGFFGFFFVGGGHECGCQVFFSDTDTKSSGDKGKQIPRDADYSSYHSNNLQPQELSVNIEQAAVI